MGRQNLQGVTNHYHTTLTVSPLQGPRETNIVVVMNLTKGEILFNTGAILSLLASVALWFFGMERAAIFIGIWVPSILGWMVFFTIKNQQKQGDS